MKKLRKSFSNYCYSSTKKCPNFWYGTWATWMNGGIMVTGTNSRLLIAFKHDWISHRASVNYATRNDFIMTRKRLTQKHQRIEQVIFQSVPPGSKSFFGFGPSQNLLFEVLFQSGHIFCLLSACGWIVIFWIIGIASRRPIHLASYSWGNSRENRH